MRGVAAPISRAGEHYIAHVAHKGAFPRISTRVEHIMGLNIMGLTP
jgi:hypothetical protein